MNTETKILAALDAALEFPNNVASRVNKFRQSFDQAKNEHVLLLEYRVRVNRGGGPHSLPTRPTHLAPEQTNELLTTLLAMVK